MFGFFLPPSRRKGHCLGEAQTLKLQRPSLLKADILQGGELAAPWLERALEKSLF